MAGTLYMETTGIEVIKTCSEIEAFLLKRGVTEVWKKFNSGEVESVEFVMPIDGNELCFRLPFKWEAIQEMASKGKTRYRKTAEEPQARKVAARLVLRWVQAQFALIDTGMLEMQEVFMPYFTSGDGTTFYEYTKLKGGLIALNPPGK